MFDNIPDIKDIKDVVWVFDPLAAAILVLLCATAAFLIYRFTGKSRGKFLRNRREIGDGADLTATAQQPYWVEAREAIEKLDPLTYYRKGAYKEFYIELTDIIRRFLSRNYLIDTYDKTSFEIIEQAALREKDFEKVRFMDGFFQDADLVKFAKYKPSQDEMKDIKARAMRIATEFVRDKNEIR